MNSASMNNVEGESSGTKKPRILSSQMSGNSRSSTENNTAAIARSLSLETSSSHQGARFRETLPGQIRAPALFKCVRVTSIEDDGEDEYAYQAMVKIGGHVFKGFLYDQGLDDGRSSDTNFATTLVEGGNAMPNLSELHLGGGVSTSGDLAGFLGGTNYGNPMN